MAAIKNDFTFKSASGLCDIHASSYKPESGQTRAVVQIAHGMAEHRARYEKFAEALCKNGFAVYINDHLGHGESVADKSELGFFGKKDGYLNFIADCHRLFEIAREENPGVPYIFFGHSMGSFVARNYTYKYAKELDGAIFCGTSAPNPAAGIAIKLASLIAAVKGDHHRSKFIDSLAFSGYNSHFEGRTNFDWLTRDNYQVDKYVEDELCGFLFTANGYRDLFSLLSSVSTKQWFATYPKELPVLVISGSEDPVGNYSKGIHQVVDSLKAGGKENVELHLYDGARHEILNEDACFDSVVSDITAWADKIINK